MLPESPISDVFLRLAKTVEQVELAHFLQKWLPHYMILAQWYKRQGKKFQRDVEVSCHISCLNISLLFL
jgi:hypothetical protein